jgi:hypothetical protein
MCSADTGVDYLAVLVVFEVFLLVTILWISVSAEKFRDIF